MSRELNYGIFDETTKEVDLLEPRTEARPSQSAPSPIMGEVVSQIKQLRAAVKSIEMRTSQSESRISSLFSSVLSISERQQKQSAIVENSIKSAVQNLNAKMSQLVAKVLKTNTTDNNIQELIDNHNEVVQKFEARLEKLQRRIVQQEMQLMSYRSVVNELIDRTRS